MQCIGTIENNRSGFGDGFGALQLRALRREARRVHAGVRGSVTNLNRLAARVECDLDAILRGSALAKPRG
jgi:hypothetical protein